MPIYEYECGGCGMFAELRSVDEREQPAACPQCRRPAQRALSAPQLASLSTAQRRAHAANERSAHEPRRGRQPHRHGAGCGCGKSASAAAPVKGFANKRPWMISH